MAMKIALTVTYSLLLLACTSGHAELKGTVLWYVEREAGIQPYRVRYIITPDFMRSDEGDDEGAFVLFDRDQRQIYSVVPQNRTILHLDGTGELPQVPPEVSIDVKRSIDENAPRVAGKTPVKLELLAAQQLCYSAVVVAGYLEQARDALQEWARALAIRQSRTLAATPREYQTPCFLARYIYASDFHLQHGMPLADWSEDGQRRELIEYEDEVEVDQGLFELPDDYAMIKPPGQ